MNLVLFDFDGTITHRDTFTQFILFATPKPSLRRKWLRLLPAIIQYKFGLMGSNSIRKKILYTAFKDLDATELQRQGELYAKKRIPNYLCSNAMARLQWHKDRGDKVVIVSASLDLYLQPWCKEHNLDLMCTEVEIVNGKLTGYSKLGDCSAIRKQRGVQAAYNLTDYEDIYAYGDTYEDNELLALAAPDKQFYRYFES